MTLYKLTFCDFEAYQSVHGYINLTNTHKYFQVIQFMSYWLKSMKFMA